jgi:hypothetical protein
MFNGYPEARRPTPLSHGTSVSTNAFSGLAPAGSLWA